jgi:hemoglobin-like flavoprotein
MTPEQITLVKESWAKVVPISDKAAELFYGKLFESYPEVQPYFKGDMQEQGRKLMAMINTAVTGLDDLGPLVPAVQEMGKRHAGYGVKDEDYDKVAVCLLWTLEQGLGDAFTPATKEAWTVMYTTVADVMKAAAAEAAA